MVSGFIACGDDHERSDAAAVEEHDLRPTADAAVPASESETDPDAAVAESDAGTLPNGRRIPSNGSFETAKRLAPGAPPLLQDVVSATQVDFFVFPGKAGDFVELDTNLSDFSPDNALWLYDADHELLAYNDTGDRWPGDLIDARLVVRLPRSGDYYVRVEDRTTPEAVFSNPSFPLLFYRFTLNALNEGSDGVAREQDGDSSLVHFAQDPKTGYSYATLIGSLEDGATDHFQLESASDQALIGHANAPGIEGNGSSAARTRVSVLSSDQHPLATIERDKKQENIHPPVGNGAYEVTVEAQDDPGDNGFYAIDLVLLPDNPREQHEQDNDALSGAESIDFHGQSNRRGLVLSTLPDADVDYYRFSAVDHDYVAVACEAESAGSGVRGLRAEVRDSHDQALTSAQESSTENLLIQAYELVTAGEYFVRLSADMPADSQSVEPWARCAVLLSP